MLPIFFPYTTMPPAVCDLLYAGFGRCIVYQPSKAETPERMVRLAEHGLVELRFPFDENEEEFCALMKAYRGWAAQQGGKTGMGTAFLKSLGGELPFFDDTMASQIQSQIRARAYSRNVSAGVPEPMTSELLKDRIFLAIAQAYDEYTDSVSSDLKRVDILEKDLLQSLLGTVDTPDSINLENPGHGANIQKEYMAQERLEAWTRLMLSDPLQKGRRASGLFVTSSLNVFEQLLEAADETGSIARINDVAIATDTGRVPRLQPLSPKHFVAVVSGEEGIEFFQRPGVATDGDLGPEPSVRVDIAVAKGVGPHGVFRRCLRLRTDPGESPETEAFIKNTVVVCIRTD